MILSPANLDMGMVQIFQQNQLHSQPQLQINLNQQNFQLQHENIQGNINIHINTCQIEENEIETKKAKKVKYPPSAFLLFCKDFRPAVHQKCPGLNPIDLTRLLSQLWKYLDPEIKQNYILKRQKIINEFLIDHPNYNGETSVDFDAINNNGQDNSGTLQEIDSKIQDNTDKSIKINAKSQENNRYPLIGFNQNRFQKFNQNNFDIDTFLSHFQTNQNHPV